MNLNQLETFITVADCGSFNKASEKLFISSTAVIKQINQLEDFLTVALFHRSHRGLTLTDAGTIFYKDALDILYKSHSAIERVKLYAPRKVIRIGLFVTLPDIVIRRDLPVFRDALPRDYSMEFISGPPTVIGMNDLIAQLGTTIDFLFTTYSENALKIYELNCIKLTDLPSCALMSFSHPLAAKDILEYSDLESQSLIWIREAADTATWESLQTEHKDLHFELLSFEEAHKEIEKNPNKILLSMESFKSISPSLKMMPINWSLSAPFGILYPKTLSSQNQKIVSYLSKNLVQE